MQGWLEEQQAPKDAAFAFVLFLRCLLRATLLSSALQRSRVAAISARRKLHPQGSPQMASLSFGSALSA